LALIQGEVASVISLLPVGYALAAGMMATINPCGFALLPAYISIYLGNRDDGGREIGTLTRLIRALAISVVVALGFVLLFGSVGLIISAGGRFLIGIMPWAGLLIGIGMVLLGIWLLIAKGRLHSSIAAEFSAKIGVKGTGGVRSYFLFGIAYGIASLSCTLPVFLVVVGSSLAAGGFLVGFYQFISYALGMSIVLTVLTVGMALVKEAITRFMRSLVPYVERASAVFILLAGGFVVYYWLTIGGLGKNIQNLF
jgi:cytochrome c biogenesis protein CcdA